MTVKVVAVSLFALNAGFSFSVLFGFIVMVDEERCRGTGYKEISLVEHEMKRPKWTCKRDAPISIHVSLNLTPRHWADDRD